MVSRTTSGAGPVSATAAWAASARAAARPRRPGGGAAAAAAAAAAVALLAAAPGSARSGPDGWRAAEGAGGAALRDAVAVGREGGLALYACRGRIGDGVHLGRRRADFAACHVGYDGREVAVEAHEVLAAAWHGASGGVVPPRSLDAGQEMEEAGDGRAVAAALYPCRADHQGGTHTGQVREGAPGCVFGFAGGAVTAPAYEVLQAAPWMAWATATSRTLPADAVAGGAEGGEPLFVCRAADRGGLRPGKVARGSPGCSTVSDGREAVATRFEVLVPRWLRAVSGVLPVSGLPSGHENGAVQYPCRVHTGGAAQIGKAGAALAGCHVGVLGREVVVRDHEVLGR